MEQVKHRSHALAARTGLVALAVVLGAPATVLGIWLVPQPAVPTDPPALVLPGGEVRALIARDRAIARTAPDDELEARRRALYRDQGLSEVRGDEPLEVDRRHAHLELALHAIRLAHGEDAVAAVRARDVERMIPALAGQGTATERAEELGGFEQALERWGAVVQGRRVADELVVRTLFAARWNVVHRLPPTTGFGRLRLRAYHGWLALHGEAAGRRLRVEALEAYERAGGLDADEARAFLASESGEPTVAAEAFEAAYAREGTVRLRNHALAEVTEASLGD